VKQSEVQFGVVDVDTLKSMSGLEFIEAMRDGRIPAPPIAGTLCFSLTGARAGEVRFDGTPLKGHYNPIGSVHGGWAATLLDSCMGCAVQTMVPMGSTYTTLELSVNFVRAITLASGPMQAIGHVLHSGRRSATAEGRLVDGKGTLYAHGTTTCMIMPL